MPLEEIALVEVAVEEFDLGKTGAGTDDCLEVPGSGNDGTLTDGVGAEGTFTGGTGSGTVINGFGTDPLGKGLNDARLEHGASVAITPAAMNTPKRMAPCERERARQPCPIRGSHLPGIAGELLLGRSDAEPGPKLHR